MMEYINLFSFKTIAVTPSHSILAGGLPEISYTTRLIPLTSLMIRFETFPNNRITELLLAIS